MHICTICGQEFKYKSGLLRHQNKKKQCEPKNTDIKIVTIPNKGNKIRTIIHIADIHIRRTKRHIEYQEVFYKFYEQLKGYTDAILVICGDILDQKTNLSPESVNLTKEFFYNVGNIMPTFVIPGNHDTNLQNNGNLNSDPLQSIIQHTQLGSLYYMRDTGIYEYGNICLCVSSVFDETIMPSSLANNKYPTKTLVALYHGGVGRSITDVGHRLRGEHTVEDFNGYDIVLLGDTHRFQYMNDQQTIAYPGSLIQQNHSENLMQHGYLEWSVETKKSKHIHIHNNYGYITLDINNSLIDIPELMPSKPYIRFRVNNTPHSKLAEIEKTLKKQYDVQTICRIPNNRLESANNNFEFNPVTYTFKDYLTTQSYAIDVCRELNDIHNQYLKHTSFDTDSNIFWKLSSLRFSNFFCYDENNYIEFDKLEGVVGLFGDNHCGKSSFIDVLLFSLFDRCSRGRDRCSLLNHNKKNLECIVIFESGEKIYKISRRGDLKGKTLNIRVKFEIINKSGVVVEDLTKEDRNMTQKQISLIIGTYDSFVTTNVALQNNRHSLFDMNDDQLKIHIENMLNVSMYDVISKRVKADLTEKRVHLKHSKNTVDKLNSIQIEDKTTETDELRHNIQSITDRCTELMSCHNYITNRINIFIKAPLKTTKQLMNDNDKIIIDIKKLEESCIKLENKHKELCQQNEDIHLVDISTIITERKKLSIVVTNLSYDITVKQNIKELEKKIHVLKEHYDIEQEEDAYRVWEIIKKNEEKNIYDQIGNLYKILPKCSISKDKLIQMRQSLGISPEKNLYNDSLKQSLNSQLINLQHRLQIAEQNIKEYTDFKHNPDCEFCTANAIVLTGLQSKSIINELRLEYTGCKEYLDMILLHEKHHYLCIYEEEHKIYDKLDCQIAGYKVELKVLEQLQNDRYNNFLEWKHKLQENKNILKQINDIEQQCYNNIIQTEINSCNSIIEAYNVELQHKLMLNDKMNQCVQDLQQTQKQLDALEKQISVNNISILDVAKYNEAVTEKVIYKKELLIVQQSLNSMNTDKDTATRKLGQLEAQNIKYKHHQDQLVIANKEYYLVEHQLNRLETYNKCIGHNGLPLHIMKNVIPELESYINIILVNYVDYKVCFEFKEEKHKTKLLLNVYKGMDSTHCFPAENLSGSESYILGLAFRVAVARNSKISFTNFSVIDEGFGCLDQSKINNIDMLFEFLRHNFKFALVVTHINDVKENVDTQFTVLQTMHGSKIT